MDNAFNRANNGATVNFEALKFGFSIQILAWGDPYPLLGGGTHYDCLRNSTNESKCNLC